MKKIIFSIVLAIILSGCYGRSSTGTVKQPEGKIVVDNNSYTMIGSNSQWKEGNVEVNAQTSDDIYGLADQFNTLEVKKEETIKLEIEKNPTSIKITKLNEDGTSEDVEMKDNSIIMPTEEGYYIYELNTTWKNGRETFVFDVNVN